MFKAFIIFFMTFSIFGNEANWDESDIPMQVLSYGAASSINIGNSNYNFFKNNVDTYNSRYGHKNPIGDLKYNNLGKLFNMSPYQVCLQLEVSCQSKLSKKQDCSVDNGDGYITCNNIRYKRVHNTNESSRTLNMVIESQAKTPGTKNQDIEK